VIVLTVLAVGTKAAPDQLAHGGRAARYVMFIPPGIEKLNFLRVQHDVDTLSALPAHNNASKLDLAEALPPNDCIIAKMGKIAILYISHKMILSMKFPIYCILYQYHQM
jgi:hypothetical protein